MITKANLSQFRLNCMIVGLILLPVVSACGQQQKPGTTVTVKTSDNLNTSDTDNFVIRSDSEPKTTRIEAPFTSIQSDEATGHSTLRAPFVKIDSHTDGSSTLQAPFVRIDQQGDSVNIRVPFLKKNNIHVDNN